MFLFISFVIYLYLVDGARPSARLQFSMDTNSTAVFIFGGSATSPYYYDDMWVRSSDGWTQISYTGDDRPMRRANAAMCVTQDNSIIVAGGYNGDTVYNDVWEFLLSNSQWMKLNVQLPTIDDVKCVVVGDSLYVSGQDTAGMNFLRISRYNVTIDRLKFPDALYFDKNSMIRVASTNSIVFVSHQSGYAYSGKFDANGLIQSYSPFGNQCTLTSLAVNIMSVDDQVVCISLFHSTWQVYNMVTGALASGSLPWSLFEFHDVGNGAYFPLLGGIVLLGGQVWNGDEDYQQSDVLMKIDVTTKALTIIEPHSVAPMARSYHAAGIISNMFIMFGGETPYTRSDTWIYNLDTGVWREVLADGAPSAPQRRSQHAMYVRGVNVILSGGKSQTGTYLGDMWSFSVVYNTWVRLFNPLTTTLTSFPRERGGHMMFPFLTHIGIAGGTNEDATAINDMWVYMFRYQMWVKVDGTHSPLRYSAYSSVDGGLLVVSGEKVSGLTTTSIYYVALAQTPGDVIAFNAVWQRIGTLSLSRVDHVLIALDVARKKFLIHGGISRTFGLYKSIFELNLTKTSEGYTATIQDRSDLISKLPPAFGHVEVSDYIRGNSILYGGNSDHNTITSTLRMYPIEKAEGGCSKGTIGPYPCTPCPAGFYGPHDNAISTLQCLPCPLGQYTDTVGQSICKPCSSPRLCNVGSTIADEMDANWPQYFLNQVSTMNGADKVRYAEMVVNYFLLAVVLLTGLILLLMACFGDTAANENRLKGMDWLFDERHHIVEGPMIKRKTSVGGVGTIFFIVIIIPLYAYSIIPVIWDNSIVSATVVLGEPTHMPTRVQARVRFNGVTSLACVAKNILVTTSAVDLRNTTTHTQVDWNAERCEVTWWCDACTLMPESLIDVFIQHYTAFARSIQVTLTTKAATPTDDIMELAAVVSNPGLGTVFRGLAEPSIVTMTVVPLRYDDRVTGIVYSGYEPHLVSAKQGGTVTFESFHTTDMLRFQLKLEKQSTSHQLVVETQKVTGMQLASSLLGLTVGVISGSAVIVNLLEKLRFLYFSHKANRAGKKSFKSLISALKDMTKTVDDDPYDRRVNVGVRKFKLTDLEDDIRALEYAILEILRAAFPDRPASQGVTLNEFRFLAAQLFGEVHVLEDFYDQVFRSIDSDGSGLVDERELSLWIMSFCFEIEGAEKPRIDFPPATKAFLEFQFNLRMFKFLKTTGQQRPSFSSFQAFQPDNAALVNTPYADDPPPPRASSRTEFPEMNTNWEDSQNYFNAAAKASARKENPSTGSGETHPGLMTPAYSLNSGSPRKQLPMEKVYEIDVRTGGSQSVGVTPRVPDDTPRIIWETLDEDDIVEDDDFANDKKRQPWSKQ